MKKLIENQLLVRRNVIQEIDLLAALGQFDDLHRALDFFRRRILQRQLHNLRFDPQSSVF